MLLAVVVSFKPADPDRSERFANVALKLPPSVNDGHVE